MNQEARNTFDLTEIEEALDQLERSHQATHRAIQALKSKLPTKQRVTESPTLRPINLQECSQSIGKQVKVLNPRKGEPSIGFIQSVGKKYVTIGLPGHKDRRRMAKNLMLIDHHASTR